MGFKFSSINQFRNLVANVRHQAQFIRYDETEGVAIVDRDKRLPKIVYLATTKIHGTNAGIQYFPTKNEFKYLSRERVLSLEQDNAGFMLTMKEKEQRGYIKDMMENVLDNHVKYVSKKAIESVVLYGEWAGGNIQKGVAVSGLEKFFAPFAIKFIFEDETEEYVPCIHQQMPMNEEERVFPVSIFGTWKIKIDFEQPHLAQNELVELCLQVEKECPAGKYFGRVVGTDNTVGEGIVIRPLHFANDENGDEYKHVSFSDYGNSAKIKGELHSVSKVKTTAAVDVESIENMKQFIEYAVTPNRMEQMLQKMQTEFLKPFEMTSMGDFIRLVYGDVLKEEQDTIAANKVDPKKLGSAIATVARKWYINTLNSSDL